MELREALAKANQELEIARLDGVTNKTIQLWEAIEFEPSLETLANMLYLSLAARAITQPHMVNVIARQYMAICMWLGWRAKELMDAPPKKKKTTNGSPGEAAS